jgi:hypothetical protein
MYDGLGNPVGFLPALAPLALKALPFASKALPFASKALPHVSRFIPRLPGLPGIPGLGPFPGLPRLPGLPSLPIPRLPRLKLPRIRLRRLFGEVPGAAMTPAAAVAPATTTPARGRARWVRAPMPYTGLRGRRLYMRCSVWPGPRGMVPAHAVQAQPGAAPGTVTPVAPVVVAPASRARRYSRRRR